MFFVLVINHAIRVLWQFLHSESEGRCSNLSRTHCDVETLVAWSSFDNRAVPFACELQLGRERTGPTVARDQRIVLMSHAGSFRKCCQTKPIHTTLTCFSWQYCIKTWTQAQGNSVTTRACSRCSGLFCRPLLSRRVPRATGACSPLEWTASTAQARHCTPIDLWNRTRRVTGVVTRLRQTR